MTPAPRLVVLLLVARIAASQTLSNAGRDFRVVFPENIAYYYPSDAQNKIWVTALHNDTSVMVSSANSQLNAGQTKSFTVTQELGRLTINETNASDPFKVFNISDKTVHITSNKDIIVQAISSKGRSTQSVLVIPTTKLSNKYFIPPVPEIEGTTSGASPVANVTERAPFRLIIVNPNELKASVTIKGGEEISIDIESGSAAQIWVKNDNKTWYVEANKGVAVFFSHPCAVQHQCTCGLLHAMVPPAKNNTMRFPIPPVLDQPVSILRSDKETRERITFGSSSAVVESAGTAIVYWPGLLLTLVPVEEFGSCFVVQFIEGKENVLIIVVNKNHQQGIHIGNDPLEGAEWQELKGTEYSSTNRSISSTTVVWHAAANMTVYQIYKQNDTWFGNPAAVISANPDFRGCVSTPEVTKILQEAESWQESIRSCKNQTLDLISLPSEALQKQTCQNLRGNDAKQVWIGTRRSSLTGDWYWLDESDFNDTNWAGSEPGDVSEGQCAVMSLEGDGDCGWKDRNCCEDARPLCYAAPQILQIN
ncbi:uncharacterized protein LOC111608160 [Xiphophorus maculatus]|uniref:uncharacterized protein LOC111608160 n=1 Tax=Xiphophorus maculatus TaxID=8083 RepID=UPI000C6CA0E6|nr:uncharacterized protein LOC111608160 [Xiphophorus maculatus]